MLNPQRSSDQVNIVSYSQTISNDALQSSGPELIPGHHRRQHRWRLDQEESFHLSLSKGHEDIHLTVRFLDELICHDGGEVVSLWASCALQPPSPTLRPSNRKFSLPAVFTIGPAVEPDGRDLERLKRYAQLLTGESDGRPVARIKGKGGVVGAGRSHIQDIIKGIIEGETRSLVSTMTMEEVFRERGVFKKKVIEGVQQELDQFGLRIYNANVKELEDSEGSEYFAFLGRKAQEAASSQAKIDVAEARSRGAIGEAEKQSRAKQEIAKINATTAVLETERKGEKAAADAKLTEKEINIERDLDLGRISAKRAADSRDADLQREVEVKRAGMELERRRAIDVVKAKIARESAEQAAQADLYKERAKAEAQQYQRQTEAEASYVQHARGTDAATYDSAQKAETRLLAARKEAEATYARHTKETDAATYDQAQKAEAKLVAARKEAEASYLARKAEAQGISQLAGAYGELAAVLGGSQGLMQYLMLQDNVHEKLALANAKAVQGLQPKINVWTTGPGEGGGGAGDPGAAVRNIFQQLPPLFDTINQQTGMTPPGWLMGTPQGGVDGQGQGSRDGGAVQGREVSRKKTVNGQV